MRSSLNCPLTLMPKVSMPIFLQSRINSSGRSWSWRRRRLHRTAPPMMIRRCVTAEIAMPERYPGVLATNAAVGTWHRILRSQTIDIWNVFVQTNGATAHMSCNAVIVDRPPASHQASILPRRLRVKAEHGVAMSAKEVSYLHWNFRGNCDVGVQGEIRLFPCQVCEARSANPPKARAAHTTVQGRASNTVAGQQNSASMASLRLGPTVAQQQNAIAVSSFKESARYAKVSTSMAVISIAKLLLTPNASLHAIRAAWRVWAHFLIWNFSKTICKIRRNPISSVLPTFASPSVPRRKATIAPARHRVLVRARQKTCTKPWAFCLRRKHSQRNQYLAKAEDQNGNSNRSGGTRSCNRNICYSRPWLGRTTGRRRVSTNMDSVTGLALLRNIKQRSKSLQSLFLVSNLPRLKTIPP